MKEKVFSNLIWRFGERIVAQLISFIVTIVLARILNPSDYGVVALITVIIAILQILVDGGFGNALIQKKDADDTDFSSVFFFNIVFCSCLYLGIYYYAPSLADFYGNTTMTPMVRVLGLVVIISGVKNVQQAYVSKTMQFKKFFYATLIGTVISAIVGLFMAINGFGAWALIAQHLTNAVFDTIVVWFAVKWRPKLLFSITSLKSMFSYGWKLLVSNLIDTTYGNIRQMLIGKLYSSSDLAFYNRGRYIPNLIVTNINTSIDSVLFPVMSGEQDDSVRLKAMAQRSIKVSNYIMSPLMMGIAFMAEPIIKMVLTDKWLPCVPYVRIFCILYMFQPIQTVNTNVIKATGHSGIRLYQEIVTKIVGLLLLFISLKHGVLAIAYAYLFGNFINQYVNSYPNKKLIKYSYWEQLKDILPSIALAVFMGGAVYCISYLTIPLFVQIVIQIAFGIVVYIFGSIILKIDSFYYIIDMIKKWTKK